MTVEQACCVCCGMIVQSLTFALGIVVGASLRRKEPNHGSEPRAKAPLGH